MQGFKVVFKYMGAYCSAVEFGVFCLLFADWIWTGNENWELLPGLMVALLALSFPLMNQIKDEDDELEPFIHPGWLAKAVSRGVALFAFLTLLVCVCLRPKQSDIEAYSYGILLTLTACTAWLVFASYVFGVRVIYSERLLVISRHPFLIFRPKRIRHYLKQPTARDSQKVDSGCQNGKQRKRKN